MNSARVRVELSKLPRIALVVVELLCFCTPRIIMHAWLASRTTATLVRAQRIHQTIGNLRRQPLLNL